MPVYASDVDQAMNMSLNFLPTKSGYSDEKNARSKRKPPTPSGAVTSKASESWSFGSMLPSDQLGQMLSEQSFWPSQSRKGVPP